MDSMVNKSMLKIIGLVVCLSLYASLSNAATISFTGKLVDRQCSVEDVFQYQPPTEKRCTLWFRETFTCPAGTCTATYTIYCPRKTVDDRAFNSAYDVCSDGYAMQILKPTQNYTIVAYPRTIEQQLDGYGQFLGIQFGY